MKDVNDRPPRNTPHYYTFGKRWRNDEVGSTSLVTPATSDQSQRLASYPAKGDIHPILCQCWSSVVDGGPTLTQYRVNVSCLLGRFIMSGSPSPVHRLSDAEQSMSCNCVNHLLEYNMSMSYSGHKNVAVKQLNDMYYYDVGHFMSI